MKIICISDIHQKLQIDKEEKEKLKRLYSFLDEIKTWNLDKLIIAGDLFDVWYEYKTVIPKPYFTTLTKLKSISNRGIKIIYLAGNTTSSSEIFYKMKFKQRCILTITNLRLKTRNFLSHMEMTTHLTMHDTIFLKRFCETSL